MRRSSRLIASLAVVLTFAFFIARPALAQEDVPYTVVQQLELAASDAETFAAQVRIVAEAAAEADIGAEFAWNVYRYDNTFMFVTNTPSLATLEDPEAMARAFEGTSVAGKVTSAMQTANALNVLSASTEIVRVDPELSYQPANSALSGGAGGAMIVEEWVKGDQIGAWRESVQNFMGWMAEAGGVYPILVTQDIVGNGGRSFVVLFDNLENFYGENSMEVLAERAASPDMAAAQAAHARTVARSTSQISMRMPNLSYQPGGN